MKASAIAEDSLSTLLGNYLDLCKPKVVVLIVFTAIIGMFLAVPGMVPLQVLVFGTLGIGLAASSAAAFNHFLDRKQDATMGRTSNVWAIIIAVGVNSNPKTPNGPDRDSIK